MNPKLYTTTQPLSPRDAITFKARLRIANRNPTLSRLRTYTLFVTCGLAGAMIGIGAARVLPHALPDNGLLRWLLFAALLLAIAATFWCVCFLVAERIVTSARPVTIELPGRCLRCDYPIHPPPTADGAPDGRDLGGASTTVSCPECGTEFVPVEDDTRLRGARPATAGRTL